MIRNIQEKDLESYLKLVNELVDEKEINLEKAKTVFLKLNENPDFQCIGYFDDDDVLCGTISCQKLPDLTGDFRPILVLENIIVKEDYRRHGVGRKMIEYIEDFAKKNGYRAIAFFSASKRKESHQFYEAMGYCDYPVKGFKKYL